ncbi:LCP family protein required for cell wall assembly [Lipingzhangella halophila]|uniref:LCP family protein required for cell wall assembly n=1 Tax=Lipingzhangella halophila TaxID=1783352 RepID=A0A7W7RL52_9ACTN|nr:LCP family protein [Lipingzhangella halophila]MBB4933951.1 LCP family protein required for cell wall assembly [Lipingzhangella halophila]
MKDHEGDGGGNRAGRDVPEFSRPRSSPTPPTPPRPARARGLSGIPDARVRRQRSLVLLAAALSCLVLLVSGSSWAFTEWVSGKINRFDVFSGLFDGDRPEGPKGALTFLVIGTDHRSDSGEAGGRSDTMMLVHLNRDRDHANIVGLPRDSWVDIPGRGKDKINAAYSHGGPRLAVQTVESTTNVRIDHYVEVDFSGFVDVVDALGGVEVCLPEPIDDPKAHLSMDAGTHEVDGERALAFSRTRQTSGGDLDRIDRQQQVLSALLQKALSSETLSDPSKLTSFLDTALGAVTVDEGLDTASINELAGQVSDLGMDDVTFAQVPVTETDYQTPRSGVAVRWNEEAAHDLFADINADRPISADGGGGDPDEPTGGEADERPRPDDIQLQVFNGTGAPGKGEEVRTALADAGFATSGAARNWPTQDVATTLVRHAPGDAKAAALVSKSIPGSEVREDATLGTDVQVVIGSDYTSVTPPESAPSSGPDPADGAGEGPRDEVSASTARDNVCG